jgi:hypothetical protein
LRQRSVAAIVRRGASESVAPIRAKRRLRRVVVRACAVKHENFLIAKIRDSESARCASRAARRASARSIASIAQHVRIKEMPAAQGFPAILTFADLDAARTFCIDARMSRRSFARSARRARALLRQHFLKLDAVFFVVLVYSG